MKEEYISMQSLEKISKFDKQVKITIMSLSFTSAPMYS